MVLVYSDDRFLMHRTDMFGTGAHPECPARLESVLSRLQAGDLWGQVQHIPVIAADDADLLAVHTAAYLQQLRAVASAGGGRLDADTVMSEHSADAAWLAAGAALDAVSRVLHGEDSQALCLVRPPGHHALPSEAMGFCLLATASVAARAAVSRAGADRVLIVDWDVHHGNGTQAVFYEDPAVTFFSAHRFPFYPGTGRASETGRGRGAGTTFNLPLAFGVTPAEYLAEFSAVLQTAADRCRPELIILSAGFDAHAEDPVGSLGLETEHFGELTAMVQQVADTHCEGRLVSVLEGGYNTERLADCVELHLSTLMKRQADGSRP